MSQKIISLTVIVMATSASAFLASRVLATADIETQLHAAYDKAIDLNAHSISPHDMFNAFKDKFGLQNVNDQFYLSDGNTEFLWKNIVKLNDDVLIKFVIFRKKFVVNLLAWLNREINCQSCSAESVGTISLRSDYDISVIGNKSWLLVKRFNEEFRSVFKRESSEIFDTNLYGSMYYQVISTPYSFFKVGPFEYFKYIKIVAKDGGEQRDDLASQRSFAFMKIVLALQNDRDIEIINRLSSPRAQAHYRAAADMFAKLKEGIDFESPKERNLKYVDALEDLLHAQNDLHSNPSSIEKQLAYKNSIARSNFYASEAYYTQGAVLHVVANLQARLGVDLTINEYVDSFIENIGDLLTNMSNYSMKDEACFPSFVKLSKYLYRAVDAVQKINHKLSKKIMVKIFNDRVSSKIDYVRKKIRNKLVEEDCGDVSNCVRAQTRDNLVENLLFKELGTSCVRFKKFTLDVFVHTINALYANQ